MANKNDETLTYRVKTEGEAELRALAKGITSVGDASGEAEKQANALLDDFANTAKLQGAAKRYRELSTSVLEYQQKLRASSETINDLAARERELTEVENARAKALASAKAELDLYRNKTGLLAGTTQQIAAAQKEARDKVKQLTAEYRDSVKARQAVTNELVQEREAASKASAARDRELVQAKELRTQLEANGQSVTRIAALEKALAVEQERVAESMRQLAAATQAAKTAQDDKAKADERAKIEAAALARATEIEADALKAVARAERDAVADRDKTEKSIERINDAFEAQGRKLAALRRDLEAAGASTAELSKIEQRLAQSVRSTTTALDLGAGAARIMRNEEERLAAEKARLVERERTLTQARVRGLAALERWRKGTADARIETKDLGDQVERTGSIFGRLRGWIAGAVGALSVRQLASGVVEILKLGDSAERTRKQFESLYGGAKAGDKAIGGLKDLANDLGIGYDGVRDAAVKLKAFGIDPLNGSLKALLNENAKMGGSQERLEGVVLAVGQAWTKQKLQAEEVLQMAERGIPVWDLLARATGKSVPELMKLSEAGKLGRKEISLLLQEIEKMNAGAAAKNAGTLSGLFTQLQSKVRDFLTLVANSGALDYFKGQLDALNKRIQEMAKSGELADLAKKISDGIVGTAEAIRGVAEFVAKYGETIMSLARAFIVLKTAGAIGNLANSWIKGFGAAEAGAGKAMSKAQKFGASLRNLGGGAVAFAAISAAVDFTVGQLEELVKVSLEYFEVQAKLKQQQTELAEAQKRLASSVAATAKAGRDALRVELQSSEELNKKTRAQLESYLQALRLAQQEARRLKGEARIKGDIFGIDQMEATLVELGKAVAMAESALQRVGSTASLTGDFARKAVKDLEALVAQGRNAADALQGVFDNLDLTTPKGVRDLIETLEVIGPRSKDARAALEGELLVALEKLDGEQLRTFQADAVKTFASATVGARETAMVLDTALKAALERLGVSAADAGVKFTQSGKDIIATFKAVLENARATGPQIAAAFKEAIAKVSTREEAEALGEAIKKAGTTGKIGLDLAKEAAAQLSLRLREISIAANPLADDFARLGIKSKAELDLARDAAKRAFDAIVEGARKGKASQDDVRAAFIAYAESVRESTKNSASWQIAVSESQLRVVASTNAVSDALAELGENGKAAGADVAAGANQATTALDETADSAKKAADNADDLGDSTHDAADGLRRVADEGNAASEAAFGASAAFADAATMAGRLDRITFGLHQEQTTRYEQELAATLATNEALSDRGPILSELRANYNLLSDAQLQTLANAKMEQRQAEQRRREEQQRRLEESQRTKDEGSSGSGGGGGAVPRGELNVNFNLTGPGALDPKNKEAITALARAMAPEMVRLGLRGVRFS